MSAAHPYPSLAAIALLILAGAVPIGADGTSEEAVLTGPVEPGAILGLGPGWQREYDSYAPAASDLASIAAVPRGATLDVYFGSWCDDSRVEVPHLIRILDEAKPRHLRVRYIGVDRSKKEPAKLVQDAGIERVPTFILQVKRREIGRVVETPETTLEHDLAILVLSASFANP